MNKGITEIVECRLLQANASIEGERTQTERIETMKIYHIIPFKYLKECILNRHFKFSAVAKMAVSKGDPNECFVEKEVVKLLGEEIEASLPKISREVFISCWSKKGAPPQWDSFSQDHCSVRIETTIGKLKRMVEDFVMATYCCFNSREEVWKSALVKQGPVTYGEIDHIRNETKELLPHSLDYLLDFMFESLFYLNEKFSRESEFRTVLYYDKKDKLHYGDRYPEDPTDVYLILNQEDHKSFIQRIEFDPNAATEFKQKVKRFFVNQGFDESIIIE